MIPLFPHPARTTTLAIAVAALGAVPGHAIADLSENEDVFARLLNVAIAHEIRDKCETISARELKAKLRMLNIYRFAKGLGYTHDEITTYTKDKAEQERLRQATYAFLDENGVDREEVTGYCALGEVEIENASPIGKLLRID